jgi:hypothetical protein
LFTTPRLEILNGTDTMTGIGKNFKYCRIDNTSISDLHHYQVIWATSGGRQIRKWKKNRQVFVIGSTRHIPYSYLVYPNYYTNSARMDYQCRLYKNNILVDSLNITV